MNKRGYKVVIVDSTGLYKDHVLEFFKTGKELSVLNMYTTNENLRNKIGYTYIPKETTDFFKNKMISFEKDNDLYFSTKKDINNADIIYVEDASLLITLANKFKNTLFAGINFVLSKESRQLMMAKNMLDNKEKIINIDNIKIEDRSEDEINIRKVFDILENINVKFYDKKTPCNLFGFSIEVNDTFSDFAHTIGGLVKLLTELDESFDDMDSFYANSKIFNFHKNEFGEIVANTSDYDFASLNGMRKCVLPLIYMYDKNFRSIVSEYLSNTHILQMLSEMSNENVDDSYYLEEDNDICKDEDDQIEDEDSLFIDGIDDDDPDRNILLN